MRQTFASSRFFLRPLAGLAALAATVALLPAPALFASPDEGDAPAKKSETPAKDGEKTSPASTQTPTETKPEGAKPDGSKPDATKPAASGTDAPRETRIVRSYSRASDWQLDFKPGLLRLYTDPSTKEYYWYFTYQVVNRTGTDRLWAPSFDFFTERGEIKLSGRKVPSRVTEEILDLLGNPLLEDQNQILGDIKVGEEHAKDGLVVWPAGDADVNELTVFVAGASGRVRRVSDAKTGELKAERWALRFNYLLPGEAPPRGSTPVAPTNADDDVKAGAERRPDDVGVWLWR